MAEENNPEISRSSQKFHLSDGSESILNHFIQRKAAVVYGTEYTNCDGYGQKIKLFFCTDNKADRCSILEQTYNDKGEIVHENIISFDDSMLSAFIALMRGDTDFDQGLHLEKPIKLIVDNT